MAQEEDFSKLSIEDKVNHKVPNIARVFTWCALVSARPRPR